MRCVAIVALAAFAASTGCSGNDESAEAAESEITATEANDRREALREHVIKGAPASGEAETALKIKFWDVFSGTDWRSGFTGAVFYASDANTDVKYVFAVDAITKQAAIAILSKAGEETSGSKIDAPTYAVLLKEVARLRDKLEAISANERLGPPSRRCAIGLAAIGLTLVVAAGAPFILAATGWIGAGAALNHLGVLGNLFVTGTVGIGATAVVSAMFGEIVERAVDLPTACTASPKKR